jgi:hypothetical protein
VTEIPNDLRDERLVCKCEHRGPSHINYAAEYPFSGYCTEKDCECKKFRFLKLAEA